MGDNNDDYAVGYGRPPKTSQFKPGQSGNPRGRRKRPKEASFERMISDSLAETVTISENGGLKKITKGRAAAKQLANRAGKGDLAAMRLISAVTRQLTLEREDPYVTGDDARERLRKIIERWTAQQIDAPSET